MIINSKHVTTFLSVSLLGLLSLGARSVKLEQAFQEPPSPPAGSCTAGLHAKWIEIYKKIQMPSRAAIKPLFIVPPKNQPPKNELDGGYTDESSGCKFKVSIRLADLVSNEGGWMYVEQERVTKASQFLKNEFGPKVQVDCKLANGNVGGVFQEGLPMGFVSCVVSAEVTPVDTKQSSTQNDSGPNPLNIKFPNSNKPNIQVPNFANHISCPKNLNGNLGVSLPNGFKLAKTLAGPLTFSKVSLTANTVKCEYEFSTSKGSVNGITVEYPCPGGAEKPGAKEVYLCP